jgi:tetratricopeptide (TPR) repeat protein
VKEDPYCPRNSFYYARELTFYNRHTDALKELKRYLDLPTATWADERAFAMRLLGATYHALGNKELALDWYTRGTAEAPHRRESWFALAEHCYKIGVWDTCYDAATRCISTPNSNQWPTDSRASNAAPHDIAAIAAYHLGKKEESVKHGRAALELSPEDERLKANMRWYLGET